MSGCHFTPTKYASARASTKLGSASSANAPVLIAAVGLGAGAVRGEHAERDRHDQREDLRVEHQLERHRQRRAQLVGSPAVFDW